MSRFRDSTDRRGTPTRRGCRRCRGVGHTLIEILLALGLSLVILAAVYAALDQHWRYADAGQRQTERMQVIRALFERMSLDLRAVVFRRAADPERATGTGSNSRIDVVRTDELDVGPSVGIVGDGQKLILRIDVPSGDRSVGPQSVRWEMHAGDSNLGADSHLGLARIVQDPAAWEAAKKASPKDLWAAEVETIRFRYFARGSWFDRWDSVARQELPQAVEITIGLHNVSPAARAASGQAQPGEYHLLVPVPASEA